MKSGSYIKAGEGGEGEEEGGNQRDDTGFLGVGPEVRETVKPPEGNPW